MKKPKEPKKPKKPTEPKKYLEDFKTYKGNSIYLNYEIGDYGYGEGGTLDFASISISDYYLLKESIEDLLKTYPDADIKFIDLMDGSIDYTLNIENPKYDTLLAKYHNERVKYNKECTVFEAKNKIYKKELKEYNKCLAQEKLAEAKAIVAKLESKINE